MKPYHLTLASVLLIAIAVLASPKMAVAWVEPFCDNDEIPVVTDEGEYTSSRTELSATITNAPGATKYKYAIGTSPGGNGTKNWTDSDTNPIVCDGLDLENGETYYFSVHYLSGPCWSGSNIEEAGFSDGITVDCPYDPIVFYPPPSQQVWREYPYPGLYWEPVYCDCLGVTLTCAAPDVTILYTTDGSDPSETNPQSRVYDPEGVVVVDPTKTIKAVAYLDGLPPGPVEIGHYQWDYSCTPPTYEYRKDVLITAPPIDGLRMGAIYADDTYPEPKNIRIEWTGTGTFAVKRILGEQESSLGLTDDSFLVDNFDFVPGADYSYAVAYVSGESMPPGDYEPWDEYAPPELTITRYYWEQGDWQYIDVTPMEVIASESQVVDSRLDTRYVEDKFVNYQFKDAIYRGGLFVGRGP